VLRRLGGGVLGALLAPMFPGLASAQPGCGPNLTRCPNRPGCVNLQSDPNNCGTCGTACPQGSSCRHGTCQRGGCPAGEVVCGAGCCSGATPFCNTTTSTCVQCLTNTNCAAGQTCCGGQCLPACPVDSQGITQPRDPTTCACLCGTQTCGSNQKCCRGAGVLGGQSFTCCPSDQACDLPFDSRDPNNQYPVCRPNAIQCGPLACDADAVCCTAGGLAYSCCSAGQTCCAGRFPEGISSTCCSSGQTCQPSTTVPPVCV
jgi:hypothetical protein